MSRWQTKNVALSFERYRGKSAVRLVGTQGDDVVDKVAIIPRLLTDGVIEVEATGWPEPGQPAAARSYFGIAFRMDENARRFEAIYIRPENSVTQEQLRRNRSAQFIGFPDRPWQSLRLSYPGKYENYAPLEPGAWTKLRIVLEGRMAKLYVNNAGQPSLVVLDLDPAPRGRQVGLWIGNRTIALFRNIEVQDLPPAR